jgi:GLTT repeat (6 copies)
VPGLVVPGLVPPGLVPPGLVPGLVVPGLVVPGLVSPGLVPPGEGVVVSPPRPLLPPQPAMVEPRTMAMIESEVLIRMGLPPSEDGIFVAPGGEKRRSPKT